MVKKALRRRRHVEGLPPLRSRTAASEAGFKGRFKGQRVRVQKRDSKAMVRERDSALRPVSDGLSGGDKLSQPHLQTFHMRERDFRFEASQRRRRDARGTGRRAKDPWRLATFVGQGRPMANLLR